MESIPLPILIYGIVQSIGLLIPVILIGYRQGRKDQEITEMKARLTKVDDKLNKTMATWDISTKVLTDKINNLSNDVTRISTTLDFIREKLSKE